MNDHSSPLSILLILVASASATAGAQSQDHSILVGEVRIDILKHAVAGTIAGAEAWRLQHPSLESIGDGSGYVVSPTALGGSVYYGTGSYLLELDAAEGRVVNRYVFPDNVKTILRGDGCLLVTYGRSRDRYPYEDTFVLSPRGEEPQLYLSGDSNSLIPPSSDALKLCSAAGARPPWLNTRTGKRTPPDPDLCRAVIPMLRDQADRDPTNPFLRIALGALLKSIGQEEAAQREADKVLDMRGNARILLLRASTWLEEFGFREQAGRAFEIGYRVFLESGNEPEQFSSIIGLVRHSGGTGGIVQECLERGDLDEAVRILDRNWQLAPLCQGAALAWAGLARELENAGRTEEARAWRVRAERASASLMSGGNLGGFFDYGSQGINLDWSMSRALALLTIILVIRVVGAYLSKRDVEGESWTNQSGMRAAIRRHVSAREVLGMALLIGAAYAGLWYGWVGKAATRTAGELDLASQCGSWGSLPSRMDWSRRIAGEGGREVYALCLIQARQLDQAIAILDHSCHSAEARNNLGVALALRGREEDSAAAFEDALQRDPSLKEALYNLGRPVEGARVDRARALLPGRPILALPNADTCARALIANYEGRLAHTSFPYVLTSDERLLVKFGQATQVVLQLLCIAFLVALILVKADQRRETRGAAWWLGAAVPGTSRLSAPIGALVLGGYLYCSAVLSSAAYGLAGNTSPLERTSLPNAFAAFGVSSDLLWTWRGTLISGSKWFVVLAILLNVGGILAHRFLRPKSTVPDNSSMPWTWGRGALFVAAGIILMKDWSGLGFWLLGLSVALAGVGSTAEGLWRRYRIQA